MNMNKELCNHSNETDRCVNTYNYNHYHCNCCGESGAGNIGIAPEIGDNGNWFLGGEDTGVKARGEDGKSAYQTAVEHGFTGTEFEWIESLKGDKGEPGNQGAAGPQGPKGDTGAAGPQGPVGNFAAMDVLFDGVANVEGNTYQLSKAISGYKSLIIEFAIKYKSNDWGRQHRLIPDPIISNFKDQYSNIMYTTSSNNNLYQYGVTCCFPTSTTFHLGWVSKGNTSDSSRNIIDAGILKIYGLK